MNGPVVGRVAGAGEDARDLGRWCYVKLNRTGGKITWIIAAYHVQNNPYGGTETVYNQQLRLLVQQGINDPKPHKTWDNDFLAFLKEIPDNNEIIVGIDANAPLHNSAFTNLLSGKHLQDLITKRHGENTPPTYNRGSTTIDHIVTSPRIVTTVKQCSILPSRKYYASDHQSIYMDIPNKQTFGGLNYPMTKRRKRKITTKLASINEYKQDVSRALRDQDFQTLLHQKNHGNDPEVICAELEKLDYKLTNRIKNAYNKIKTTPRHWWTPEIHKTNYLVNYWSAQVSLHNNNIEATVTLHHLETIKPPDCDIYQGDPSRNRTRQLQKAKRDRHTAQRNSYDKRQKYLEKTIENRNKDKKGLKITKEIIRIK
jgi:hypothetical protein